MLETLLAVVTETIRDVYAYLGRLSPDTLKSKDCMRDISYLRQRTVSEGLTFLTVQLPRLGDWADQMVWGSLGPVPIGFRTDAAGYPVFLRPLWKYLSQVDGLSCDAADAQLIRMMRTLLLGLKKLDVPFSQDQVDEKLSAFFACEEVLENQSIYPSPSLERAQVLCERWSKGYIPSCDRPSHGPGAVAGGERDVEKWSWTHLYQSLHKEWPYWEFLYPVRSLLKRSPEGSVFIPYRTYHLQLASCAGEYKGLALVPEPTARLLFVPKDSRGPRIISCEPKELMYVQQGVSKHLMRYIESHEYTRGRVNFVDQTVNSQLALDASRTREWDTIDLSDASDRVGVKLVTYLFPREITRKWLALRSTATLLPNGEILRLHKFAPMGSALCFPVESLVFWALAVAAVWEQSQDLSLALSSVYVYGDDIIVRRGYTEHVMDVLESVDLKVNRDKSFICDHPFRESCGVEALNGHNVTPFRVKKVPPCGPRDGTAIMAWTKYAENSQYFCPMRSRAMLDVVEDLVGPVPRVKEEAGFLSFVTDIDVWEFSRYPGVRWSPERCRLVADRKSVV